ncbi:MAG TPA: pyrroline-5-carboxylate reductase [Verrucomicrobiales bacterium]|nr:pyrroline-5-carboxylate reductase [Verrucomicrobiales bacterium]
MHLAVLGCGKMGSALIRGILQSPAPPDSIHIFDIDSSATAALQLDFPSLSVSPDPLSCAAAAQTVLLCVKPHDLVPLVTSLANSGRSRLFISIAAGIPLTRIESAAGSSGRVIRVMPNTPALVGRGVSAVVPGSRATEEDVALAESILSAVGTVVRLPEKLLDAVTGVSGSGPAYIFLIIEALSDAGVSQGLPRPTALTLAAETVLGAAEMVLRTGLHPAQLKDQVTSPGGTTIAALEVLERRGVRGAFFEAVAAAARRSEEMGREN